MAKISPGTMTAAIFAILLGLAGAYTVRNYMQDAPVVQKEGDPPPPARKIYVPVAARDLLVGQELTLNDIAIHSFTPEQFAKSEFVGKAYMPNTDQIIGRMMASELTKGGLFMPDSFFPDKMGPGIAENLKPGYRAVTVPVENIGAVRGFARPGSVVDVMFRASLDAESPEVTVTLLERVEILAVDEAIIPGQVVSIDDKKTKGLSVTLSVLPEQAKALKVVEGRGELSLALRNPQEAEMELQNVSKASSSMTMAQLLGIPEQNKPKQVEVYRGGQKSTIVFASGTKPDSQFQQIMNVPLVRDDQGAVQQTSNIAAADRQQN